MNRRIPSAAGAAEECSKMLADFFKRSPMGPVALACELSSVVLRKQALSDAVSNIAGDDPAFRSAVENCIAIAALASITTYEAYVQQE